MNAGPARGPARVAAVLVAVLLVLAGCSDDPQEKPEPKKQAGPVAPSLEVAWQIEKQSLFGDLDPARGDALWDDGDRFALVGDKSITTFTTATGAVGSRVELPQRVCAASPDVNASGIGIVVLGPDTDDGFVNPCHTVVAIDTRAGTILWRQRVREVAYLSTVTVGERAVAVTDAATGARRLAVADGRRLRTLGSGESISNGALIAATEGSDNRTVDIYDQDSGAVVRRALLPSVYDLDLVVGGRQTGNANDGPVLVAAETRAGHSFQDVDHARARPVGRSLSNGYGTRDFTIGDDVIVQYRASNLLDRWNPVSRQLEKLTYLDPEESPIGVADGRLLTLSHPVPGGDEVLRAIDPADPSDPLVLGAFEKVSGKVSGLTGYSGVLDQGRLLVGATDDGFAAYRVPQDGVPASRFARPKKATDADLTPDQTVDLCVGIRAASLELAGDFREKATPSDCDYASGPDARDAILSVHSVAVPADAKSSATDKATTSYATEVAGTTGIPAFEPVEGTQADEAAVDSRTRTLVARVDNAILHIQLIGGPEQPAARRTALIAIARDLVAELETRRAAG